MLEKAAASALLRFRIGSCLLVAVVGGMSLGADSWGGQRGAQRRHHGETTVVASPTSVVTMLTTTEPDGTGTLDVLIVWRGRPNWFGESAVGLRSEGKQIGTKTVLRHTYGTVDVSLEFDRESRETSLDGIVVPLSDGANVILVSMSTIAPNGVWLPSCGLMPS
jgi:hypothetical protein